MSKSTQLAVKNARMEHWVSVFSEKAESGLSATQYCRQNGISKNQYYYWLRKVREAAIEDSPRYFAQLLPPKEEEPSTAQVDAAIVITIADATVSIGSNASEDLISKVVRGIRNA